MSYWWWLSTDYYVLYFFHNRDKPTENRICIRKTTKANIGASGSGDLIQLADRHSVIVLDVIIVKSASDSR